MYYKFNLNLNIFNKKKCVEEAKVDKEKNWKEINFAVSDAGETRESKSDKTTFTRLTVDRYPKR